MQSSGEWCFRWFFKNHNYTFWYICLDGHFVNNFSVITVLDKFFLHICFEWKSMPFTYYICVHPKSNSNEFLLSNGISLHAVHYLPVCGNIKCKF